VDHGGDGDLLRGVVLDEGQHIGRELAQRGLKVLGGVGAYGRKV
jgi:hypothetical protein